MNAMAFIALGLNAKNEDKMLKFMRANEAKGER